ncbi:hypothetical protein WN51_01270 [Melipona quadrifasciata]|uniref:Uncharacterized protein n=1 Tax=Melipona quadrifasciata TaxID=166423 RepID=A0A0M8ZWT3_9HYME|nr:hypothetical protein WN51_01270 [Melipona quadrifasciata]
MDPVLKLMTTNDASMHLPLLTHRALQTGFVINVLLTSDDRVTRSLIPEWGTVASGEANRTGVHKSCSFLHNILGTVASGPTVRNRTGMQVVQFLDLAMQAGSCTGQSYKLEKNRETYDSNRNWRATRLSIEERNSVSSAIGIEELRTISRVHLKINAIKFLPSFFSDFDVSDGNFIALISSEFENENNLSDLLKVAGKATKFYGNQRFSCQKEEKEVNTEELMTSPMTHGQRFNRCTNVLTRTPKFNNLKIIKILWHCLYVLSEYKGESKFEIASEIRSLTQFSLQLNRNNLGRNDSELEAEGKPERLLGSPSFGYGKSRVQGGARRARYSWPSWAISLARVPHVFGEVGAMHQSTVKSIVCFLLRRKCSHYNEKRTTYDKVAKCLAKAYDLSGHLNKANVKSLRDTVNRMYELIKQISNPQKNNLRHRFRDFLIRQYRCGVQMDVKLTEVVKDAVEGRITLRTYNVAFFRDNVGIIFVKFPILKHSTDRNMWLQINRLGVYMGLTMLPIGGQCCIAYWDCGSLRGHLLTKCSYIFLKKVTCIILIAIQLTLFSPAQRNYISKLQFQIRSRTLNSIMTCNSEILNFSENKLADTKQKIANHSTNLNLPIGEPFAEKRDFSGPSDGEKSSRDEFSTSSRAYRAHNRDTGRKRAYLLSQKAIIIVFVNSTAKVYLRQKATNFQIYSVVSTVEAINSTGSLSDFDLPLILRIFRRKFKETKCTNTYEQTSKPAEKIVFHSGQPLSRRCTLCRSRDPKSISLEMLTSICPIKWKPNKLSPSSKEEPERYKREKT